MWGIVPAAGSGTRLPNRQCSKELIPVAGKPVIEYLLDRMVIGGADKICIVIAPGKADILRKYGTTYKSAKLCYLIQPEPIGLADAIFICEPFVSGDVLIGLPDTVWFPEYGFQKLPQRMSLLVFQVPDPENFDSVEYDEAGMVRRVAVKASKPASGWVWGAMRMTCLELRTLSRMWQQEPYVGTVINRWVEAGGQVIAIESSGPYLDIGTPEGLKAAEKYLAKERAC
jgi:dTDP-glucose pyrophosphorylase